MTIDEAIVKYKNRVEQYKGYPNMADITKEHEQLVDWLCELKELWASRGELTDFWYLEGYTKAIEEFEKHIVAEYDNDACPNVSDYLDYKLSIRELFEIAEHMKGE